MTDMPVLSDASGAHEKIMCDGFLWSFLQGELDPAEALLVATHLQLSCTAKKRLKALTTCAGAVMEAIEPQTMRCSAQAFFAEKCSGKNAETKQIKTDIACICDVPKALQPLIGTSFDDKLKWKTIHPGIQQARLKVAKSKMDTHLLKIKKDTTVPMHSHVGSEMMLVLLGSLNDQAQNYTKGEVSIYKEDDRRSHAPQISEDCICLVVASAPIRLQSLWSRILRPLQPLLS